MRFVALMSGCVVAMLALAGSASASTLAVNSAGVLRLDAKFREVNGVTLREQFADPAYVVDDTAGVSAGSGCVQVSPTRAQCLIFDASFNKLINNVVLDLGDRADTSDVFTSFGFTPVEVDGGWGDDVLSGASVDGYTARGGPGDDTIDRVATNGDPIDVDGGFGDDTVSTSRDGRTWIDPRRVRLRPPDDRRAGVWVNRRRTGAGRHHRRRRDHRARLRRLRQRHHRPAARDVDRLRLRTRLLRGLRGPDRDALRAAAAPALRLALGGHAHAERNQRGAHDGVARSAYAWPAKCIAGAATAHQRVADRQRGIGPGVTITSAATPTKAQSAPIYIAVPLIDCCPRATR